MFHSVCGDRITLFNNNKTAKRNLAEFNHGLVFSKDPLQDNFLFEVRIEKKVYAWSGGLEIGVTKCDPSNCIEIPANATDLKNGTWILSGNSILKDGRAILDVYGLNLNDIEEGDVVGVMKTEQDELVFSLNGKCKGIAACHVPYRVFAVVDLYGQVAQASIMSYAPVENIQTSFISTDLDTFDDSDITEGNSLLSNLVTNFDSQTTTLCARIENNISPVQSTSLPREKIRFHSRCGTLAKISCNGRAAERLRPFDEFNNGVIITHRPLSTGELYEIRIDRLVEKWSGSIEVGITMHNPDFLEFPPTMTNLKTGTIMMSGCGILTNGKATKRDYGDFNLDELMVGDRIGLVRNQTGDLHYVINGLNQGVAASNVPELFWGVVDLYGRTVKVTIVDRDEREEQNLITRRINAVRDGHSLPSLNEDEPDCLTFHTRCGTHVSVSNNNRTAYRPNALEDFNNGVVATSRPLKPNEPFEVKLDKIVSKWAGSIEIGVTSHSPTDLEYPSTMTNIRSGTWMMTGNGVMHNGTTVLDDYGINLDRLQVGDRVAVVIKNNGSLHLFVNGIDQGEVAANITSPMYGVIDLYGQAAQATIIEYDPLLGCTTPSDITFPPILYNHSDLRFHHIHGKNVRICNGGRTALRPQPLAEFTDAVVISNRPLKNNEMFVIAIEKIVDRWSGSIEAGVTAIKLDDLELPATMTDLDHDTWMLSGSTVMKDSVMIKHGYSLNLDSVQVGMVVGMMRHNDGSLHYYLDGVDQGEACSSVPSVVYPVIDLYGQCAQVSIVNLPDSEPEPVLNNETNHYQSTSNWIEESRSIPFNQTLFDNSRICFSQWCGKNITLSEENTVATRVYHYNRGIVFSNFPLEHDKLYEFSVTKWSEKYAGTLSLGVTTIIPEKMPFPPTIACLKPDVWYLTGDEVWHNGRIIKVHYCHNLHWLQCGSTVGIKCSGAGTLHFYINGQDQGIAASDIPATVYGVLDIYGRVTEVTINREVKDIMVSSLMPSANLTESIISPNGSNTDVIAVIKETARLDDLKAERTKMEYSLLRNFEKEKQMSKSNNEISTTREWTFFRELRGRNIRLLNNGRTALRIESYNQGVVIVSKPLDRNVMFQISIDSLNSRWVSSLMIGVLCCPLMRSSLPVTAFGFKKDAWIIAGDSVYHNGNKIKCRYGTNLETLRPSQKVGIMVNSNNQLKLFIDNVDQGVAASNIPSVCYVVVDLYGQCEQVNIVVVNREETEDTPQTEDGRNVVDISSSTLSSPLNELNLSNEIDALTPDFTCCEKADLERHEKESPSDDDNNSSSALTRTEIEILSDDEDSISRVKLNKTNENKAVIASSGHSIGSPPTLSKQRETDPKSHKTNENNAVIIASCSGANNEVSEFHSKTDKTNENNSVIGNCSIVVADPQQQNSGGITKQMSTTNCDHKTSLNIANTMFIQAEKSVNKSKNSIFAKNTTPLHDRPLLLMKQHPHCDYRLLCCRFRNFLGLPAGYFSSDSSIQCYCGSCCSVIAHECKGDPPSTYSVPNGWCKFPLKKHLMTNNVDAVTLEKWHVAFVGVSIGNIRKILDSGQLLTPDNVKIGFSLPRKSKLKDDENSQLPIILSPMIKYATDVKFASRYTFVDHRSKISYTCTAAFQVLVRPGSYKVGPPSLKILTDPNVNINTIEWVIKERESTVLSAVLFNMET